MEGAQDLIYVSQEQLNQVEYLIRQSIQGNHILFDKEVVRKAFQLSHSSEGTKVPAEPKVVEQHMESLLAQPTLLQKRAYLEKLDPKILNHMVVSYFSIVENSIFEDPAKRH